RRSGTDQLQARVGMGSAVQAKPFEQAAVVLVRPEVGRIEQKLSRLEAESMNDARIGRVIFTKQAQGDGDGLVGAYLSVGEQRLTHVLGNADHTIRAGNRVGDV